MLTLLLPMTLYQITLPDCQAVNVVALALQLPEGLSYIIMFKLLGMASHRAVVVNYQGVLQPWGPCFGSGL